MTRGQAVSRSRSAINQGLKIALSPRHREVFQRVPACIHHGDNYRRQLFPEKQTGGHRNEGDGIDAKAPRKNLPGHRGQQSGDDGKSAGSPQLRRERGISGHGRRQAKGKSSDGNGHQSPVNHALDLHLYIAPCGTEVSHLAERSPALFARDQSHEAPEKANLPRRFAWSEKFAMSARFTVPTARAATTSARFHLSCYIVLQTRRGSSKNAGAHL